MREGDSSEVRSWLASAWRSPFGSERSPRGCGFPSHREWAPAGWWSCWMHGAGGEPLSSNRLKSGRDTRPGAATPKLARWRLNCAFPPHLGTGSSHRGLICSGHPREALRSSLISPNPGAQGGAPVTLLAVSRGHTRLFVLCAEQVFSFSCRERNTPA